MDERSGIGNPQIKPVLQATFMQITADGRVPAGCRKERHLFIVRVLPKGLLLSFGLQGMQGLAAFWYLASIGAGVTVERIQAAVHVHAYLSTCVITRAMRPASESSEPRLRSKPQIPNRKSADPKSKALELPRVAPDALLVEGPADPSSKGPNSRRKEPTTHKSLKP